MKIIELLNKIANCEEVPKKIKYDYKKFEFIGGAYEDEKGKDLCYCDYSCMTFLNDEVEILEEEKEIPEKLGTYTITDETISGMRKSLNTMINIDIIGTINEIIDYLKSKGE